MATNIKKVGNYHIYLHKKLGQGSYSQVFKAKDVENNRIIAAKIINKETFEKSSLGPQDFFKQLQIMNQLKSENIIQFYGFHETQKNYYIFQELAEDGNFRQVLQKKRVIQEDDAIQYMEQILNGFIDLIKNGVVHRDVKPENILLSNNILKIIDFGYSKQNLKLKKMKKRLGTPIYMSPQILKGQDYTYKCDIWSIGILFYEMVTGQWPWVPKEGKLIDEILSKELKFQNYQFISDKVKEFIRGCLKVQEKDRFGWKQIFCHQLFSRKFEKHREYFLNDETLKVTFIMHELKQEILKKPMQNKLIFEKAPEKLNSEETINLIKKLAPNISLNAIGSLYLGCKQFIKKNLKSKEQLKLYQKQNKYFMKKDLLAYMTNYNIKFQETINKDQFRTDSNFIDAKSLSFEEKLKLQIIFKMQEKKLVLKDLYKQVCKSELQKLDYEKFTKFIEIIIPEITEMELQQLFIHIVNMKDNFEEIEKISFKTFEKFLQNSN